MKAAFVIPLTESVAPTVLNLLNIFLARLPLPSQSSLPSSAKASNSVSPSDSTEHFRCPFVS